MDKLPRLLCVLISVSVICVGVGKQSMAASLAGDIAPFGTPDGDVNVADLDLLRQFVSGDAAPGLEQQSLADLAPLNSPDGVLNIADIVVMEQAILDLVTLPPPTLAVSSPYLWGSDLVTSSYYVSGLALANATINIYRDGNLLSTATSNSNGLFGAGVDLIAGAANVIYVKAEYNGIDKSGIQRYRKCSIKCPVPCASDHHSCSRSWPDYNRLQQQRIAERNHRCSGRRYRRSYSDSAAYRWHGTSDRS
jgi:hypothetical protein